jgi:DNA-directed RNA polymerase subunit M/transcription elongation factor TFIIS
MNLEQYCVSRLTSIFNAFHEQKEHAAFAREIIKEVKRKTNRYKQPFKQEFMKIIFNTHLNKNKHYVLTSLLIEKKWTARQFVNLDHDILDPEKANERFNIRMKKFNKLNEQDIDKDMYGILTCPNCKGNKTTYHQLQCSSGDESMTTFALCKECGKRWKFR